jgi:hypothetical protein
MKLTSGRGLKLLRRVILIIALGALIFWGVWELLITGERVATITVVSGTVLYSPAGESQWTSAVPGMKLHFGDQLLTQPPESSAIVVTDDGNIGFRLSPDTLLTYTARWNALLEAGKQGVHLSQGVVMAETRHDSPPEKTRFAIETEAAQVHLTGSRLIVQKLKAEPTTHVSALSGEILVQVNSDTAKLVNLYGETLPEDKVMLNADETVIVYNQDTQPAPEFEGNLGQVVDSETGEGVGGILVQVVGKPELFSVTGEDGYFDIPGNSIYDELVVAGSTVESEGELLLLPYTSQINQQVLDVITKSGIPHARIMPLDYPELAVETNSEGIFVLRGLPVGNHSLVVLAEGYISLIAEATVTPQGNVSISDIQMLPLQAVDVFLPMMFRDYNPQYP